MTVRTLEDLVSDMKAEVTALVRNGTVPQTVKSFGDLHDYIDANCLAGVDEDETFDGLVEHFGGRDEHEGMPQGRLDYLNAAQGQVDDWIKLGSLMFIRVGIASRGGAP